MVDICIPEIINVRNNVYKKSFTHIIQKEYLNSLCIDNNHVNFLKSAIQNNPDYIKSVSFWCLEGNKIENLYKKLGAKHIKSITLKYLQENGKDHCKSSMYGIDDINKIR